MRSKQLVSSSCDDPDIFVRTGSDTENDDGDFPFPDACDTNTAGEENLILIGAVPFKTLRDPNGDGSIADSTNPDFLMRHSLDGWNNKLTYAVTRNLTKAPGADPSKSPSGGAICVTDENNRSLLELQGSANYVLISHGENGVGAYTEYGEQIDDCVDITIPAEKDAVANPPWDERKNCSYQVAEPGSVIKFVKGIRNETDDDYYDDTLKFYVSKVTEIWASLPDETITLASGGETVKINRITNVNGGNIGVGLDDPREQLHVLGDVQSFEMHAEELCDSTGENCFPPEYIGGEVENMRCPEGKVITKIGRLNNDPETEPQVHCVTVFGPEDFKSCPPGQFLRGLTTIDVPVCGVPE